MTDTTDTHAAAWDAAAQWIGVASGLLGVVAPHVPIGRPSVALGGVGVGLDTILAIVTALRAGRSPDPIPRLEDVLPAELLTTLARAKADAAARAKFAPPDDGGAGAP